MGLLTRLIEMKSQKDLQAKITAIEGYKALASMPDASPE